MLYYVYQLDSRVNMRIAIFDDNPKDRESLSRMIHDWIKNGKHSDTVILEFSTIRELSSELDNQCHFDVFFLDIVTPEAHDAGYRLAENIRARNIRSAIIFTTNSAEYMADAFEISTYRYLVKPVREEKVWGALENLASAQSSTKRFVSLFHGTEENLLIEHDKILSLEAFARFREAKITLTDGTSETVKLTCSFSELLEKHLPQEFIQCCRGIVINMHHVKKYSHNSVCLGWGDFEMNVSIGRKYRDDFLNKMVEYHRGI